MDTKGNILRLITNRFDLGADEISEIYCSRWVIELFFKWLKQHVEIKHFYGMSETAIHNQFTLRLSPIACTCSFHWKRRVREHCSVSVDG